MVPLALMGCASPPLAGPAPAEPMRLLVAGTVDLSGPAATVARADTDGLFREIRLAARRADVAVVVAATSGAADLLAAAGFTAVACPDEAGPSALMPASPAAASVRLRCATGRGLDPAPATVAPWAPTLLVSVAPAPPGFAPPQADLVVTSAGPSPAARVVGFLPGHLSLVVSGLGSLLSPDPTAPGALLEVLADAEGVVAYRLGRVAHHDFRVHFSGWDLPRGDAVLLDGEWWTLARPADPAPVRPPPDGLAFTYGDLVAAAIGDATGDGLLDLAASYRHPFRPSTLSEARPGVVGMDSLGRSAHLGVFTLSGEALWAAGYIWRPVGDLAACEGAVALAYTGLDDPAVVATGAAVWQGLSLEAAPELPGSGRPGCADVDGDGRQDPVILGRAGYLTRTASGDHTWRDTSQGDHPCAPPAVCSPS